MSEQSITSIIVALIAAISAIAVALIASRKKPARKVAKDGAVPSDVIIFRAPYQKTILMSVIALTTVATILAAVSIAQTSPSVEYIIMMGANAMSVLLALWLILTLP